jgi:hypothetical protein
MASSLASVLLWRDIGPMPRSICTGPPATIADMRRIGISAFIIECAALCCYHRARLEFDALLLPDELYTIDVTKHRRARNAARAR